MEAQRLCAYNQTRECFLGLEVAAADLSAADLKNLLRKLVLRSGEGLWMEPFRGIPETSMRVPLDLIYLDEACRVIEVVESFPTFHVSPSSPRAASVLALPIHSIYSSQTQRDDQLVLCVAEEMQGRLEKLSGSGAAAGEQGTDFMKEKPLRSGGPAVAELEGVPRDLAGKEMPDSLPPAQSSLAKPEKKDAGSLKSWLVRWWSPDPKTSLETVIAPEQNRGPEMRKTRRMSLPGLAAYYWNGAAPTAHSVKDISLGGMYVVTEERWYPGTVILMTLRDTLGMEKEEQSEGKAIAVAARAVRWGDDGVGLEFILQDSAAPRSGMNPLSNGATRRELEQFLEKLRRRKDQA